MGNLSLVKMAFKTANTIAKMPPTSRHSTGVFSSLLFSRNADSAADFCVSVSVCVDDARCGERIVESFVHKCKSPNRLRTVLLVGYVFSESLSKN